MTVRTAEARKTPQLIVKDPRGNITKVVNVGDLQVGFPGDEASLVLTGGMEVTTRVVKLDTSKPSYTLATEDLTVCVNAPVAAVTISLPTIPLPGKLFIIKDIAGTAATYPIELLPANGITIDGAASTTINDNYGSFFIIWNGSQWVTIARGGSGGIYAPSNASYLTVNAESGLTAERHVVSNTSTITFTDGGANSTFSVDLHTSGVTPGTYGVATNVSVDTYGRVTAISNGPILATTGLSGSLQQTTSGLSYLVAGPRMSITTGTNGQITVFTSVSGTWRDAGNSLVSTSSVSIDASNRAVSSLGSDVFFFVSGSTRLTSQTDPNRHVALFGGNVFSSGSVRAELGLSGSLTQLSDGTSYLIAGSNITISSASNGAVTITSTATGGGSGGSVWVDGGNQSYSTSSISIDPRAQYVSSTGTDIQLFVSGTSGPQVGNAARKVAVFGGDMVVSGTISGSIQRLSTGQPYLVAGNNVTITSASAGSITIAAASATSVNTVDIYNNRPTAGTVGRMFFGTDTVVQTWLDDGTAFRPMIGGTVIGVEPPLSGTFGNFNLSGSLLSQFSGSLEYAGVSNTATPITIRGFTQAIATTSTTAYVEACILLNPETSGASSGSVFANTCIIMRESSTQKTYTFGFSLVYASPVQLTTEVNIYANNVNRTANTTFVTPNDSNGPIFLRIRRDTTKIYADWSRDRRTWRNANTSNLSSVFTTNPDQVGIAGFGILVQPRAIITHWISGSL